MENKKVLYSAVVLTKQSAGELMSKAYEWLPADWINPKLFAHHMTINLGPLVGTIRSEIGNEVELEVHAIGKSDKAVAIGVTGYTTSNAIPHVTIWVNVNDGGKPKDSNGITDWKSIEPFTVKGIVTEVTN